MFWGKSNAEPSVYRRDWHVQALAPFGAGRQNVDHPCPRPLEQVEYVVDLFSNEAETILDPFMGSGTTGVACVKLKRRFVGIEKEPKYFEIAKRRIMEALGMETRNQDGTTQRRMFCEPEPSLAAD